MARLLDSGLLDPEFQTFWGCDAKKVADVALTATAAAAVATIPAVFFHASKSSELRAIGDVLGLLIWFTFLTETLLMVRLHHGWGGEWLRTHKLQVVVVILSNPLLVWAIGRYETLELSTLLPLPSVLQSAKFAKLFKFAKIVKFLHLGEVSTKVRTALAHVPWLVNTTLLSAGILALGIIGAVLDGESATPIHALDVWLGIGHSMVVSVPKVLLATVPLCLLLVMVIARQKKMRDRS
jgi:hypothetical protein